MKGRGRNQIWVVLGVSCLFAILPCSGYGAELIIGNNLSTTGNLAVNGTVSATSFSGDGSGLSNVPGPSRNALQIALLKCTGRTR